MESFGSPFLLYYGAKGVPMTKTEFIAQGVDDLRAALLELFEDNDGAIASANKKQLVEFARDNWDYIDSAINPVEEEDATPEGNEEEASEAESEGEEGSEEDDEVEEILDQDLSKPNPRTDLYTGRLPS